MAKSGCPITAGEHSSEIVQVNSTEEQIQENHGHSRSRSRETERKQSSDVNRLLLAAFGSFPGMLLTHVINLPSAGGPSPFGTGTGD